MAIRILASLFLLLSVLFLPFWLSLFLALAGMAYFPLFIEAAILLLLTDLLYAVTEGKFFGVLIVSFTFSVLLLVAAELLKKRLKFYS